MLQARLILHLTLIGFLILPGCSGWAPVEDRIAEVPPPYHLVVRGENLFRIAWRYGLDYREIAQWNNLASPDRILAGQRLRLTPPGSSRRVTAKPTPRPIQPSTTPPKASRPQPPKPSPPQQTVAISGGKWEWPAQGTIVKSYNPAVPGGKGIQIGGTPGQSIKAASNGEIVYKGSGLSGYGRLIIVKHSDSLLSAYGYLGRIFVQEGETVRKGQIIAEMDTGEAAQPVIHFEVRKNGRPINPLQYLSS